MLKEGINSHFEEQIELNFHLERVNNKEAICPNEFHCIGEFFPNININHSINVFSFQKEGKFLGFLLFIRVSVLGGEFLTNHFLFLFYDRDHLNLSLLDH